MESSENKLNPLKNTPEVLDIESKLEHARRNAILESRLVELEQELEILENQFIKSGTKSQEQVIREEEIEREILNSAAIVNSLGEYRDMLTIAARDCNVSQTWVEETLAHENSHANVAESLDFVWIGYAIVYIKDEQGKISSVQPLHMTKPQMKWGPKEVLSKRIEVTSAPKRYDNALSDSDIASIEKDKRRLEEIGLRENRKRVELDEVRARLGMKK